jgi:hypothetical protein
VLAGRDLGRSRAGDAMVRADDDAGANLVHDTVVQTGGALAFCHAEETA